MKLIGILVALLGFILAVLSLTLTSSVNGRLIVVLAGIAISLFGIIGIINPAFQNAVWRKRHL